MAETEKPKGKLKPWQYAAALGGAVVVYVVYKRMKNTSAAAADSGTTDANTLPGANTTTTGTTSTTTLPATLADWEQAVLSAATGPNYSPSAALNDITSWLSGQCVSSQGFSALGSAVETLGLPPGYNTGVSPLTVCPDTTVPATTTSVASTAAPAPAAPASSQPVVPAITSAMAAALAQNNESIVDAVYNQYSNTFDYLTNKGGIYTVGGPGATNPGGTFYGSYLGLAGQQTNQPGQFEKLTVLPNGGYTLLDSAGQTYTFGPNVNPTTGVAS